MTLIRIIASSLLLSLVVIASANYDNYGSSQNPNVVNQGHNYQDQNDHHQPNGNLVEVHVDLDNSNPTNDNYDHTPNGNVVDQLLHHSNPTNTESSYQKEQYGHPTPQEGYKIPVPEGHENNAVHTESYYYSQDKKTYDYQVQQGLVPSINAVVFEGNVLCKSGDTYTPISGAIAKITCPRLYDNGYNKALFTIFSPETNEKGCFLATLQVAKLVDESVNLKECKVYVEESPLESCNVPTNYRGNTGAYLTPYRTLTDEKYYTAGSFVFTVRNDHYSVPAYQSAASKDHTGPGY